MRERNNLSKIPADQKADAEKIIRELKTVKKTNKMGLNITNLKKKTQLSHTSMTKALSSLSTAEIIDMEQMGNSKVYYLRGDE